MPTERKVALVTGANKGIGLHAARVLGKAGWTVLLGVRNPQLGRAAESKLQGERLDAHFVELDLTNSQTISEAAGKIQKEFDRLDLLINKCRDC
jgi:NAD(P)-dependent dehydrogenase (short-subunit alcohol dehydrogenase family)